MRKRVVILKMSLLLVCLSVRAQTVIPAHVSIDILGFDKYNGVAIACKHNPQGSFQATHAFAPDPRVETIISGPVLIWTISPKTPDVSFSPTNQTTVQVKMENDAACGKEYSVKIVATWTVRIIATGEIKDTDAKATVTLAAIKLAGFTVASKSPKPTYEGGQLTDNREGVATIKVEGMKDPSGLSFAFTAKPVDTRDIINKMGTAINFTQSINPLVFDTSKIYWYGVNPTNCCYFYTYAYEFVLKMNGCCSVTNKYSVGMPIEKPGMVKDMMISNSTVKPPEAVPGVSNFYRCEIVFDDFTKKGKTRNLPATDQYADEIAKEENRHLEQWQGSVSEAEGGSTDLYTAKGTKWWLGWIGGGPCYVYGSTADAALTAANEKLDRSEETEMEVSANINLQDKGFIELKAKEFAGYNAAWKYHCCYERVEGWGPNPVNHHHPAYPVSP